MDFLSYVGVGLIISLIFIVITMIQRDRYVELQVKLSLLKDEYEEKYKEKYNRLIDENIELKKYKTLYELECSKRKK